MDRPAAGGMLVGTRMLGAVLVGLLALSFGFRVCAADRGMVPLSDVSVFGPGQKAIVAWNGVDEVLILSTDVYAQAATMVLEVLPLPSEPDVIEKTDVAPFSVIEGLMHEHKPVGLLRGKGNVTGVEIVFREKIGPHDITVVKVKDSKDFEEWASAFLQQRGIGTEISSRKLASLVDSYLRDGVPFFVLDLVEVSSEPRSIEPILYKFRSNRLYFPLRISALASGSAQIAVFAISSGPLYEEDIPRGMSLARFAGPMGGPVQFKVEKRDLEAIHPQIGKLFPGDAWLSAVRFSGELKDLDADLSIGKVQVPVADMLVGSRPFWLMAGVAIGVVLGLILAQVSLGVLKIGLGRLIATLDLIGSLLLMILAWVLTYAWSPYAFWALVVLAMASLFLLIRTAGRGRLVILIAVPFLAIIFVYSLVLARTLEIALALVLLVGFVAAAAFPPARERRLSEALRRRSKWFETARMKRRL